MFGYVTPDKPELKVREYELYSGYYCGLCKSVKRRYGRMPALFLNYDFVFLSLVLGSLSTAASEQICRERCPVHPLKKRSVVYDETAIDYAADMMLMLGYFKLMDDKRDEGGIKPAATLILLKKTYKKIMKRHSEKCIMIQGLLGELSELEKEKCNSLDKSAEPFGKLMGEVFSASVLTEGGEIPEILRSIGYHMGKWIYLIDAYDDIEEDAKTGSYNPLILQWNYQPELETVHSFKSRIKERTEFNLLFYLTELSRSWEELNAKRNGELISNIIYLGLLRKTEEILKKGNTAYAKPL